jgi:hypothetical protein
MKSIKCPACGFVSFSNSGVCKSCGQPIVTPSHEFTPANDYYYDNDDDSSWSEAPANLKKGLAILGLVLGIVGFFTIGLLFVGAIVGLIVSIVALNRVRDDPWAYGGRGLAIAGIVLNSLSLVNAVPVGIIAAIAIPNFMASRRAANEWSAINSLRTIAIAQVNYQGKSGHFASLEELASRNLVDPQLASGSKNGYRFTVEVLPTAVPSMEGFQVMAMPVTYDSTGTRSFLIDETLVIRAADNHGGPLTRLEQPLQSDYDREFPLHRDEYRGLKKY